MTATITDMATWKRTHAKAQCDAITAAENIAHQQVRWAAACWRDWMRAWWGV